MALALHESSPRRKNVYSQCHKNVHGWICGLKTELSNARTAWLKVYESRSGREIFVEAKPIGKDEIFLFMRLESVRRGESVRRVELVPLGQLGICLLVERSKKKMQQNLLPLLSRLCVYAFLGVTHKDIVDLKKRGSKKNITKEDSEELLQLEIKPDTIEAEVYEPAFNNIFYAACYSRLIKQGNDIEYHKAKFKELAGKIIQTIGPEATESLMKSLVSKSTRILSEYQGGSVDKLIILYSSRFDNSWKIQCYCSRREMERRIGYNDAGKGLEYASSHQLLQCGLRLKHGVKFLEDCIEVELKLGELDCKASQLDSKLLSEGEKEWCFPAKISLTVGPECNKYGVLDLSVGLSSRNPSTTVSRAITNGNTLQGSIGLGTPTLSLGLTRTHQTTSSRTMTNWQCVRDKHNLTQARMEWTLYNNSSGKSVPVFSYQPYCNSRCKAFAEEVWLDRPFTRDGGVIFAADMYKTPMTWWLSKDLLGKTLKWFVEVEIWLAYYRPTYMEIRYKKFRELVELPLQVRKPVR